MIAQTVDVTDPAGVADALRAASERLGRPALVFHAAGIGGYSRRFAEFSLERFAELVTVICTGSRNVAAAALPLLDRGGTLAWSRRSPASCRRSVRPAMRRSTAWSGSPACCASSTRRAGSASARCARPRSTPRWRATTPRRPPETTAMKLFAGSLQLDAACREMVDGVLRGRFLVIPGRRARFAWALHKLCRAP